MARNPAFREALAWRSRQSLARAVDKLATGAPGGRSRRRRWTEVVGSYWQRYCSKNDTIGFESPSPQRTLSQFPAPARERALAATVEFTGMLPGPQDCWLQSSVGHDTSELRIVALDVSGRCSGTL